MADEAAIGIRLGNTTGAVAVSRDGRTDVVANDLGHRTTPAMVAFLEEETLTGMPAKNEAIRFPKQTVACAHGALAKECVECAPFLPPCACAIGLTASRGCSTPAPWHLPILPLTACLCLLLFAASATNPFHICFLH